MTYEELNEIILRGNRGEWLSENEFLIFKGDLNLRIEMGHNENSRTGESFREDWSDALPAVHPATRQVFWIHHGSTKVMEVHTVDIDQRTIVPLPDSPDHSSMSTWKYGFGRIVESYGAEYGGMYSLDSIMQQAGISLRED